MVDVNVRGRLAARWCVPYGHNEGRPAATWTARPAADLDEAAQHRGAQLRRMASAGLAVRRVDQLFEDAAVGDAMAALALGVERRELLFEPR